MREALTLAWDFDKYNRFGTFKPASSVFNNSDFAAAGLPSPGELALLEPFRAELPPRVFGPPYQLQRTNTGPNALRQNLLRARDLLAKAGWKVGEDGKLRNAKGELFEVEFLEPNETGRNIDWQRNLEKLGITLKERLVDYSLYRRRLETFDFDIVTIVHFDFTLPNPADMADYFGSKAADTPGSGNYRGVKNAAVDRVIQAMEVAGSYEELRDAARALDRIVMWSFWQSAQVYNNTEQISYWNQLRNPQGGATTLHVRHDVHGIRRAWSLAPVDLVGQVAGETCRGGGALRRNDRCSATS